MPRNTWIACDVLSYGMFTQPGIARTYLDLLKLRKTRIVLPTATRRGELTRSQIPPEDWANRFNAEDEDVKREFRTRILQFADIARDKAINNAEEWYKACDEYERSLIEVYRASRTHNHRWPEVLEMDSEMPIYVWIADEKEAVFSIPIDNTTTPVSTHEHGFLTRDKDLIKALRSTWERYAFLATKYQNVVTAAAH